MSSAYDIAKWLEGQGVGTFGGEGDWSLHVASEPFAPDNVITLYDTGANAKDCDDITRPTVQVRVRCNDYLTGMSKHDTLISLLTSDVFVATRRYTLSHESGPLCIGRDEPGRYMIVANYSALRE